MGLAGFRMLATSAARMLGISVEDPHNGPPVYAEAGQRVFINFTGIMRGRVGRALMPRVLDVMESRSAAIMRSLFGDARLSLKHRSPFLFLSRALRVAVRFAVPLRMIQALIRPEAAHARIERLGADLAGRLTFRGDAAATRAP